MQDIITGCCQFSIKPGDIETNLATVESMLSDLAARKCELLVLPEMWACSFPYRLLPSLAQKTPGVLSRLQETAAQKGLVIVGSLPEEEDGHIYNSSYVIDKTGEIAGKYRKVHLFSLYREDHHFKRGNSLGVFETSLGKIGVIICYDLRFPELARRMALEGAGIICVSAQWPRDRIEHWSLLLRARAVENQLFVVACNGCGTEGKLKWGGHSAIISPWGEVVAQAGPDDQTLLGVLHAGEIEDFRKMMPCFDDRVPEVYDPCPPVRAPQLKA